jgi:hypothetical protein
MPTKIYDSAIIKTIDNEEIEISPLKIRYLRKFMEQFDLVKTAKDDDETISYLVASATITMEQYCPSIKTTDDFENKFDLKTIYKILDIAAGIKIERSEENTQNESNNSITNQAVNEASSWESLDLAKLEAEVFLLGIWKDYQQLETSLSMPELMITLEQKREMDYQDKKFTASLKGINLDDAVGKSEDDPWEAMKARVAAATSGIGNGDPNDITALQGLAAQKAGFGIGMGLDYEVVNG